MSKYSLYKRQRIVTLSEDGHKSPTIAKMLHEENLAASRQGIQKFLKRYESSGAISRKEGTGRKSKVTEDIRRLIDEKMEEDDETSGMQLQKMLLQYGHRLSKSY
jgi:transposase